MNIQLGALALIMVAVLCSVLALSAASLFFGSSHAADAFVFMSFVVLLLSLISIFLMPGKSLIEAFKDE